MRLIDWLGRAHLVLACGAICMFGFSGGAHAEADRLLGTGGVTTIEGSAGGGLTPWALIGGLGTDRELGATAYCTYVEPQYFYLSSCGAAIGIDDRLEISYAHMRFGLGDVASGQIIEQNVFGAKLRLLGDAVFDQDRWWPQVAVGVEYKRNQDFDFIPKLIGARNAEGADVYLAATKVFLAGPFGRSWLIDATVRGTRANQFGLLGFGGDRSNGYHAESEGSVAVFLTDSLVLGAEYRQKSNELSAFRENDAYDSFLTLFLTKRYSLTVAYVSLGDIAIHSDERAWLLSFQGNL